MLLRSFFTAITRLSLRFKWITILITVVALVLGVVAAVQLNQEFLPNIEFPQTFVVTLRPGASSEDLRDLITIPLERAFSQINGVLPEGLESTTTAPVSFLTVRNDYGVKVDRLREQLKAAIAQVVADGVPVGLETTADLTPEIMTKVLSKAPSMFKHFESRHLLAMPTEVLNAAFALDPAFADQLDLLARDQLAAARVSGAVSGVSAAIEPVRLPAAWRIVAEGEGANIPSIINFSLSDIPVITSSVSSTRADITPEQLRELVETELIAVLNQTEGVANVRLNGGQQIPPEVLEAARRALSQSEEIGNGGVGEPGTPVVQPPAESGEGSQVRGAPSLPANWLTASPLPLPNPVGTLLEQRFGIQAQLRTAADLLTLQDRDGKALSLAEALNRVADVANGVGYLRTLTPEILAYWRAEAPNFSADLSETALNAVADSVLYNGAWAQLRGQSGFSSVRSLADLARIKGSAAETINAVVAETPAELRTFAVRLADALSPEAIRVLVRLEPTLPAALSPQVLRFMSAAALAALPEGFISGLSDAALRADLEAILADPSKSAAAELSNGAETETFSDDPNAPELAAVWQNVPGASLRQADDLLKKPFGFSAGAFLNAVAASPQGGASLIATLTPEVLNYVQARDPKFFDELTSTTIKMLSPETLAALPAAVQARTQDFTPTRSVTRTNQRESLNVIVIKSQDANTVVVSDRVEEVYREVQAKHPELQINTVFETAGFIRESIEGVVREGGLGAIGAVLMILVFLNFSVRSTLVAAVSIPTSIAAALILMRWLPESANSILQSLPEGGVGTFLLRLFPANITLNIMTLSGLTVAIGRVVDDSIVVLENIYRQLQKGMDAKEAVIKGTRDVSLAIFAATLTTMVVFLPIGLTGGVIGEFFLPFGLAVTYALAASFVVAITTVPVLAFMFIRAQDMPEEKEGFLARLYVPVLQWSLKNRLVVLGLATISLVVGIALFASRPTTFLPALGEPQITIDVTMPANTPIAQTDLLVREFEAYLEDLHKAERGISRYQVNVGGGGGFGDIAAAIGGGGGVNGARAAITAGVEVTGEALSALTAEVRQKAGEIFGVDNVTVSRASVSEQGFGGFAVVASGDEADLRAADAEIIKALGGVEGLTNITSSLERVGSAQSYLRVAQRSAVQYSAELEVTDTLGVTRKAIEAVRAIPNLPASINISEGFQSQQQTEGFSQTFGAMGIAILAVYAVMFVTFGSFVYPFAILFSLPLAVVGAALLLTITDRVVGISALVGMLMLIGIVVTNAIVLLDRVQLNRKEKGMSPSEALLEAGRTRLRPILMTAIATMVALSPLALGLSKGAIIATELGTVVIGGLFSSTLLTLLVVPIVYSLLDNMQRRLTGGKG
ncbi:MAG: efflux RND transporter permease subunit [Chloroflexi bacterium CFX4]|nr:efflux RND transporter permease subunit [Chloroflexi bacterium CFX4]MDL1924204.1 efflux RND transporter permease subunit [Chloroflexi bacterium CFX3]